MDRIIIALQFLTVFRVRKGVEITAEDLAGSVAYFPLVGAFQGVVLAVTGYLLALVLPWSVVAGLVIFFLVLTNGGLHLDGFVDTVDGLAGGGTPEERLRIMKDSATGAIGAVSVVILLLIKYLALSELPESGRLAALYAFPVAGRWAMVPMACWSGYARPEGGLGKAFSGIDSSVLIIATIISAVSIFFIPGPWHLLTLAFLGLVAYLLTGFFRQRLGGATGDVYGFTSEVAEVLFLLGTLVIMGPVSGEL